MRPVRLAILCFVVWGFMHVQAGAVGKIAVDPNAPGAKVAATAPKNDTRLGQKITYEAKHQTALAIVTDLSKMTGVTLKAGINGQDWQVRDRKMNIFAKDVPLADLMSSIARVMKFKWSVNRDSEPWTYRLFMDRKTLLDAYAQKARSDARIQEKLAQRRQKFLELCEHADSLSEQELAKMDRESYGTREMVSTGLPGCVGTLCKDIPGFAEAISTGQQLTVSGSQLSMAGQKAVLDLLEKNDREGTPAPGRPGGIEDAIIWVNLAQVVNESRDPSFIAQFLFLCGNKHYGACFSEAEDSEYNRGLSPDTKDLQRKLEDPNTPPDDRSETADKLYEALTAWNKEGVDPGEPFTEHPNDPALAKKIKLQPESALLSDVQCALAEASGFAVVSDCFGKTETYGGIGKAEAEIKTLLDGITKPCLYNWDKHTSVIEFRDRHWFSKRSAQIPESWIEVWRQALKKNGTLDIAELAQIADLTQEQFDMNIKDDDVLREASASDSSSLSVLMVVQQDVLRAYGALTEDERKALFSSSGLDLSALSPDQRAAVEKPIGRCNPRFLLNPDAQITMAAKSVKKGKQFDYTLTVITSDSFDPLVWTFTTPKYEPPKSEQPKESKSKSSKAEGK